MISELIEENEAAIVARTRARIAQRGAPLATEAELAQVPIFLRQIGEMLKASRSSADLTAAHDALEHRALENGENLLRYGLSVAQVVHAYGDVCQSVTEIATEHASAIPPAEYRAFNKCLDDAIAYAVTAYARTRDVAVAGANNERLGMLAHEIRNLVSTAMLSFEMIQLGEVTPSGSTGAMHARSLMRLRDLVDRSLAEVRLEAGRPRAAEIVCVAELFEELEIAGLLQARARDLELCVEAVDPEVRIAADPALIGGAVANLLQNAFKYTRPHSRVVLRAVVTEERVRIEVEDECGGLAPGKEAELFRSFVQRGADRSGVGLGLSIARRSAEATGGSLEVRNLPGKGCVFYVDLARSRAVTPDPRSPSPSLSGAGGVQRLG